MIVHTVVRVVLASPFWECVENEIKCQIIIDLIQRRCLLLFYIRITFRVRAAIHVLIENVYATNK